MCKCIRISVLYALRLAAVGLKAVRCVLSPPASVLSTQRGCSSRGWMTVGLTVASLQSCFNGTRLPLGRGERLWLLATEDQPAARIHPAENLSLFQAGRKRFAFVNSQSQTRLSHAPPVHIGAPGRCSFHLHRSTLSGKRRFQPLLTVRCLSGTFFPLELPCN